MVMFSEYATPSASQGLFIDLHSCVYNTVALIS
jgi:hypothetical protein